MLTNVIENRNPKLKKIFSLADSLARSLRKGVEIFDIDDDKVTLVTEDQKIIKGIFDGKNLTSIEVEDGSVFSDPKLFDAFLQKEITTFVDSLREDKFQDASHKFTSVLKNWGQVTSFDRIQRRLQDKLENLTPSTKITESSEFKKLTEIKDTLIEYLKENKEKILEKEQIINSLLLSNKISTAFDFPKLTYEALVENGSYTQINQNFAPIYEILCKQELIKKELLEAKENMENIWTSDEDILVLSTKIYEQDPAIVESIVAKVISKIPYFAFSSKIQISTLLENSLSIQGEEFKQTDLKSFASKIFEIKKPVRNELAKLLSKQYGISIQNLKDTPTLKSVQNSIVTILETLSKVCNKNILKDTLKEFSEFFKTKNGIEIIDINEFINEVFIGADYSLDENNLLQYMDFNRVADDVMKIGTILKMIQGSSQPQMGQVPPQMGIPTPATPATTVPPSPLATPANPGMTGGGAPMGNSQMGSPPGQVPDEQYPSDETTQGPMGNTAGDPMASAQGAKQDVQNSMGGQPQQPNAPVPMDQNNLVAQLGVLDQLLQDLSFQLGRGNGAEGGQIPMGGDQEMGDEMGGEEIPGEGIPGEEEGGFPPEGEENGEESGNELPDEDTDGDGDEDIEYVDMTGEEDSEEEVPVKGKQKSKPSKEKSKPKSFPK